MYHVLNMYENKVVASFDYSGEAQGYINANKFEHHNIAFIIIDDAQAEALGVEVE